MFSLTGLSVAALRKWVPDDPAERLRIMHQILEYVEQQKGELIDCLVRDNFTPAQTAQMEIEVGQEFLRDFLFKHRQQGQKSPDPLGLFYILMPFDMPSVLMSIQAFALFALGNTVVVRMSGQNRRGKEFYRKLLCELGISGIQIPEDISGRKFILAASSASFFRLSRKRGIGFLFAGTEQVWNAIEKYTRRFDVAVFNGPGNAIAYVDASVRDVESVARILAHASFANSGQYCFSIKTLLVDEAVYPLFKDSFLECLRKMPVGNPFDEAVAVGPIRNRYVRLLWHKMVRRYREQIVFGGTGREVKFPDLDQGELFDPTVIEAEDIPETEVFGPLVFLVRVNGFDQALLKFKENPFGLYAAFFGAFDEDQQKTLSALEGRFYGAVDFNCWIDNRMDPDVEFNGTRIIQMKKGWGGMRRSGFLIDRREGRERVVSGRYRPEEIGFAVPLNQDQKQYYRRILQKCTGERPFSPKIDYTMETISSG